MSENTYTSYVGQRRRFKGLVAKIGKRTLYDGKKCNTVLLKNVEDAQTGEFFRNHSWLEMAPELQKIDLKEGITISFDATITTYLKGYMGDRKKALSNHYKLSYGLYGIQKVGVM